MYATGFKTASELGLDVHEYDALVEVLFRMESGEIKKPQIQMTRWHSESECGTAHCIAGWCHAIDPKAFPELNDGMRYIGEALRARLPIELCHVFGVGATPVEIDSLAMWGRVELANPMLWASPDKAIRVLRDYLKTGEFHNEPATA